MLQDIECVCMCVYPYISTCICTHTTSQYMVLFNLATKRHNYKTKNNTVPGSNWVVFTNKSYDFLSQILLEFWSIKIAFFLHKKWECRGTRKISCFSLAVCDPKTQITQNEKASTDHRWNLQINYKHTCFKHAQIERYIYSRGSNSIYT